MYFFIQNLIWMLKTHEGLDPAGPLFSNVEYFARLDKSDAEYIISTNSRIYI